MSNTGHSPRDLGTDTADLVRVHLDTLAVDVGSRQAAVGRAVDCVVDSLAAGKTALVTALHVGGLLARRAEGFADALASAEVVCADGRSVLLVAKVVARVDGERAPTTDVGVPILAGVQARLGRPLKVALLGGPEGLAAEAGQTLTEQVGAEIVFARHGYADDWQPVVKDIAASRADVLVVGLGSPKEAVWASTYREQLGVGGILTCGGWFGFLVGAETRAPDWMQARGLEWAYRLIQDPVRLIGRYSCGALTVCGLLVRGSWRRLWPVNGQYQ